MFGQYAFFKILGICSFLAAPLWMAFFSRRPAPLCRRSLVPIELYSFAEYNARYRGAVDPDPGLRRLSSPRFEHVVRLATRSATRLSECVSRQDLNLLRELMFDFAEQLAHSGAYPRRPFEVAAGTIGDVLQDLGLRLRSDDPADMERQFAATLQAGDERRGLLVLLQWFYWSG